MSELYTTYAPWWPLLSPPERLADAAAAVHALLGAGSLLDLGCGSGALARHLPRTQEVILVDRSPQMLALAQANNPGRTCVCADVTTLDLGRTVHAVLLHDTVMVLPEPGQLEAAFATAARHLNPGGKLLVVPDVYEEDFGETVLTGTGEDPATGRAVVLTEWHWDPAPGDGCSHVEYTLQMRQNGVVKVVHETHVHTLRSRQAYAQALVGAGFALLTPEPLDAAFALGEPMLAVRR